MLNKNGKTVKKYRQGNMPAAFGADLWLSGSTNVPNLLLKFYKQMNITDSEMMTLIQIFRLRCDENCLRPDPEKLAEFMSSAPGEIERNLKSLSEKKILIENEYYDEIQDEVLTGYDFEPVFEKLSDHWACERARETQKAGKKLEGHQRGLSKEALASCYSSFEKEFGRLISPIEMEKITQWVDHAGPEIVQEALRRAVLIGKRNFRYIDTILLEWKKNNINSIASIEEYDSFYQGKRPARDARRRDSGRIDDGGGESNKRKALIKKLYLT